MLTKVVEPAAGLVHRADHYLNVIEADGVKVRDWHYALSLSPETERQANTILQQNQIFPQDRLAVVNAGGNWALKRWPQENFSVLIDRLAEDCGLKVALVGSAQDRSLAEAITSRSSHRPAILAGQTDLKQLLALMKRAEVVISADSGPLHMAHSVGANVIGLFGPTRPEVTGPRGQGRGKVIQHDIGCNHEPCYNLKCPNNLCMKMITVDEVIHEVRFGRH